MPSSLGAPPFCGLGSSAIRTASVKLRYHPVRYIIYTHSPKCLEGEFSEVRLSRFLRTSLRRSSRKSKFIRVRGGASPGLPRRPSDLIGAQAREAPGEVRSGKRQQPQEPLAKDLGERVEGHVLRCTPRTVQQRDDLARGGLPDLRAGPSSQKWQNIIASSSPLKRAIASVPSYRNTVRGSPQALPSSTIQKA